MTRPTPAESQDEVQAPAIITDRHAQIRVVSPVAGARKGWKKLTEVEIAYDQERLGPKDSQLARSRRDAGLAYAAIFDQAQSSGKDSTQALNGSHGGGGGIPFGIAQQDAMKQLGIIYGMLGARDAIIVKKFCGEDMMPTAAVKLAGCDKETRVSAKIREVLDDLAIALDGLRRPKRVGGGL